MEQHTHRFSLGSFAANTENTFLLEWNTAGITPISEVDAVTLSVLDAHTVIATVTPLRHGTALYGAVRMGNTSVWLSGCAMQQAPIAQQTRIQPIAGEAADVMELPPFLLLGQGGGSGQVLCRGQRMPLQTEPDTPFYVTLTGKLTDAMELDAYVFLLQDNDRVTNDKDLIFWGNGQSQDRSVLVEAPSHHAAVQLSLDKAASHVQKIEVCYSLYEKVPQPVFSQIQDPVIHIYRGAVECFQFPLAQLGMETSLVGVVFYRYKDQWKLQCVGAGYRDGLRKLCESFGVEVD